MKVRYTGDAGYVFAPVGVPPFAPDPGDVLDLDEALVASLGGSFEPVEPEKAEKPSAKKSASKADDPSLAPAGDSDPTGLEG
ncbi:MAG: hypothetical protein IPG97_15765 [Microthrixaceae bacterium]|nr:hypothetical protein [Microthrixaceae bacterium]